MYLRRRWSVGIVCAFMIGAFVGLVPVPARATVYSRYLSTPRLYQEQSMWCWAAATQIVGRFLTGNTTVSQCNIVAGEYGTCGNWGSINSNSIKSQLGWRYNVGSRDVIWSSVAFSTIKNEIDFNRPVPIYWAWDAGNGHHPVISGYYWDNALGTQNIQWFDPAPASSGGGFKLNSYNWMVRNPGRHSWNETIIGVFRR